MTYTVVLMKAAEGGYTVIVPALPGCFTEGDSVPEALDMAREAIRCHLRSLRKHGKGIPEDTGHVTFDLSRGSEALTYWVEVEEREALAAA